MPRKVNFILYVVYFGYDVYAEFVIDVVADALCQCGHFVARGIPEIDEYECLSVMYGGTS